MSFVIKWVETCSGTEEVIKIRTPAGQLVLYSQQGVISKVDWGLDDGLYPQNHEIQQQFRQYWLNTDKRININLLIQGSAYRHKVWAELCKIPFGETITYSALAGKIGSSARAVGNACRDNPYPVIIPCHRVVSVSGMGGYCGQTEGDFLAIKYKLLDYEAARKQ
ncbi:MAG: methylated-DNA--[protein]-cysteine S-methyltransferase [Methylococcaceae bacterium]|jgi:methylated-DNA-[protein]-cysteine S-methyltransferase|nr:methylated-DNA--[protein]-cysteine S-methyltransferase [Methylococcaceae bacterium]OYV16934.1 MAG: methylated-DNA-[protein]-cysteine S-methyltransferase [Methylococcaceae bacterium NSM2-1]